MAKKKAFSAVTEMEMADGSTVRLTLSYAWLYRLNARDRGAYKRYTQAMAEQANGYDELGTARMLHTAYLCGCLMDKVGDPMGFEEFLEVLPSDRDATGEALARLMTPKRLGDSKTPSGYGTPYETATA